MLIFVKYIKNWFFFISFIDKMRFLFRLCFTRAFLQINSLTPLPSSPPLPIHNLCCYSFFFQITVVLPVAFLWTNKTLKLQYQLNSGGFSLMLYCWGVIRRIIFKQEIFLSIEVYRNPYCYKKLLKGIIYYNTKDN